MSTKEAPVSEQIDEGYEYFNFEVCLTKDQNKIDGSLLFGFAVLSRMTFSGILYVQSLDIAKLSVNNRNYIIFEILKHKAMYSKNNDFPPLFATTLHDKTRGCAEWKVLNYFLINGESSGELSEKMFEGIILILLKRKLNKKTVIEEDLKIFDYLVKDISSQDLENVFEVKSWSQDTLWQSHKVDHDFSFSDDEIEKWLLSNGSNKIEQLNENILEEFQQLSKFDIDDKIIKKEKENISLIISNPYMYID